MTDLLVTDIRLITPELADRLHAFFMALVDNGDHHRFHPHPLNAATAAQIANYTGLDLYYVLLAGDHILGYGMLRGWDEGYVVPSLGIAIHPSARGRGLGKRLMQFLHATARQKGARQVRLKVYADNPTAIALYKHLGYRFEDEESGQMVGVLSL